MERWSVVVRDWTCWSGRWETLITTALVSSSLTIPINSSTDCGRIRPRGPTSLTQMCAGVVGRSFASAEASGRPGVVEALTPDCLEMVGRGLVRHGEVVFMIDTSAGMLKLLPAQSWDVDGDPDPDSWEYRITLGGPSRTFTHDHVPA